MPKYRYIQLSGYTNKNTTTLWYEGEIFTCTSFEPADFDYGESAEIALSKCEAFIKEKEEKEGWIPGYVICWINEFEIETETTY